MDDLNSEEELRNTDRLIHQYQIASRTRKSGEQTDRVAGIPVRLDHRYSIHHHKLMVIVGVTLETGSFHHTTAAIKNNAENTLVFWNVPQIPEV